MTQLVPLDGSLPHPAVDELPSNTTLRGPPGISSLRSRSSEAFRRTASGTIGQRRCWDPSGATDCVTPFTVSCAVAGGAPRGGNTHWSILRRPRPRLARVSVKKLYHVTILVDKPDPDPLVHQQKLPLGAARVETRGQGPPSLSQDAAKVPVYWPRHNGEWG